MIQFGFLVKNITLSQHGLQLLFSLNKIVEENHDISPVLFYETYSTLPYPARFAMIQNREAWLFDGPIITTSIELVQILLKCPKPNPKYFYIWNLDWMHLPPTQLSFLQNIYMNDNLKLIARSEHHARIIENCWQKPVSIIEDFNHNELTKLIRKTGKRLSEPVC